MPDFEPRRASPMRRCAPLLEVAGAGHSVVLIHAGIADHHMWDNQFALFAQQYRVIRYDMRGLGQSAMPLGPYRHSRDLYGLLQYLGIEQAHVIGVSIGGMTAVDFTLEHAAMVTALIPVAAGISGSQPSEAAKALFAPLDEAYEARDLERAAGVGDGPVGRGAGPMIPRCHRPGVAAGRRDDGARQPGARISRRRRHGSAAGSPGSRAVG